VIIKIHARHMKGYGLSHHPGPTETVWPIGKSRLLLALAGVEECKDLLGDLYYRGRLLGAVRHVTISKFDSPINSVFTVDFIPARQ
jgi:hypothetical protein